VLAERCPESMYTDYKCCAFFLILEALRVQQATDECSDPLDTTFREL
jgi:hypothetical protein